MTKASLPRRSKRQMLEAVQLKLLGKTPERYNTRHHRHIFQIFGRTSPVTNKTYTDKLFYVCRCGAVCLNTA